MLGSPLFGVSAETKASLHRLMSVVRVEILPLPGAIEQAVHLRPGGEVAVTADPEQDMAATIDLSVALAARGFDVIPHLSAQLTSGQSELEAYLSRCRDAGITRALVIGGVANEPGEFFDAGALLDAIDKAGSPFTEVGIGGYPEGHHVIADEAIDGSLMAKAPRSDWITTQICFDVERLEQWLRGIRSEGVGLPVWLGVPAVADLTGLMSLGLSVGAGRSLQFMFEHPRLVTRLLRPGGRKATDVVVRLAELATDDALGVAGFHVFTYNQVRAAERWRTRLMSRLG
jgi:methylenetetrahydrofolate reductase (NADPH)